MRRSQDASKAQPLGDGHPVMRTQSTTRHVRAAGRAAAAVGCLVLLLTATVGFAFTRGGGGSDPGSAVKPLHDARESNQHVIEQYGRIRDDHPLDC